MLRIRKEQLDVFRENAVAGPRRKIVAEIERALPEDSARLGHRQLVALVDRNIEKADSYGLGSERGTCTYCEAALLYGEDFDRNPRTAWSRDVLPVDRMDQEVKWKLLILRIQMDHGKYV
jgi:hypothetical protein